MTGSRLPLLVYDGDCGFCTRSAEFGRRLLPDCEIAAWQTVDLPALGVTADRARREVLWISADGRVAGGARAIASALRAAGGGWALLGLFLLLPPVSWVAQAVYRVVAANRHRLPGGTAACALPTSEGSPRRGSQPG